MDSSGYDRLQARADALEVEVDAMLDNYHQQMQTIAEARDKLAAATTQAWSSDNLIRVTSNAAGVPIEVWVDPQAFKRSTPQKLGASIAQAAQAAARAAKAEIADALKPITTGTNFVLENPLDDDDIPGMATSIGSILPPPPPPVEPQEPERRDPQPGYQQPTSFSQSPTHPQLASYSQPPSRPQPPPHPQPPSYPQPQEPQSKPSYAPAWENDDEGPHWKGW